MDCPSCGNALTLKEAAGIKARVCAEGCGGLWLERRQVKKIPDRLPGSGIEFLTVPRAEGVHLFRDIEHPCPQCQTTLLYRHCFDRDLEMEIDQCAKCAGFWLETGTLSDITNPDRTLKERSEKAEQFFHTLMNKKLAHMDFTNDDTLNAAQQIIDIFRFLCPPALFPDTSTLGHLFR